MYKAVITTTSGDYIMHFNKNHDSSNGQFTYGDGDGDGVVDDHRRGLLDRFKNKDGSYVRKKTPEEKGQSSKDIREAESGKKKKTYGQQLKSKGTRKVIGGIGAMSVGGFLATSDNEIAAGLGYVSMLTGAIMSGYGAYQWGKGRRAREMEEVMENMNR